MMLRIMKEYNKEKDRDSPKLLLVKKMKKLFIFIFLIILNFPYKINALEVIFNNVNEAVNFAIQNSQVYRLQLQSVLLNIKEAKYNIQDFLPTFSFTLSENDNTAILAGDTRSRSFQANVSLEVFDGGRRNFAYEINRLSSLYAFQDYESSLMEYRSHIIFLYYQYLMQRQMVIIKENLVSTARNQLNIIEKEVEIGITLETDYLEYLISFIQLENDREQSKRDLNIMERRFKAAIDLSTEANLVVNDNYHTDFTYFYYEPYIDFIWLIIKNNSTEIKKQNLSLEYARRQLIYTRRWFVPIVNIQGGISFSGESYPLTEPRYSLTLTFDFSNMNLFPLSLSNNYNIDRRRLTGVNNSASVRLDPQPTYFIRRQLADISVMENNIQRIQTEKDLFEAVYDLIISYDNSLRYAFTAERTIEVLGKRLEFTRQEVEQGTKKRIDYLQELITMAQTRITLLEYQTQATAYERSLEILAGFYFGNLRNVCN